ncbi:hypothetical protein H1164_03760 [Thermoactinomyces daqus]|uniref:Uncharacterized protein n=1 Tax=Thermoactinomyces daqus TaxID=1329516 RepID=A0A7W1X8M7_9BACL|nr:hypothetical protein [Thermoactinomyces daqus]MBA4542017.1 hypothetical protein [Thermoactinomyces daqus]
MKISGDNLKLVHDALNEYVHVLAQKYRDEFCKVREDRERSTVYLDILDAKMIKARVRRRD